MIPNAWKSKSYSLLQLLCNRTSNAVYLSVIMMLFINDSFFVDSHVQGSSVKNTRVLWHAKYLGQD